MEFERKKGDDHMSRAGVKFTVADYNALPEYPRHELIEGELLLTPSPSPTHQFIVKSLALALIEWETRAQLATVFFAPLDVILSNETVVQPDAIVILNQNRGIIKEKIEGAPDLLAEVLSPSTSDRDRIVKKRLYQRCGVREYWVVDPERQTVEVNRWTTGNLQGSVTLDHADTLVSPLLKGFQTSVSALFR